MYFKQMNKKRFIS